jgi:hypothetical protein
MRRNLLVPLATLLAVLVGTASPAGAVAGFGDVEEDRFFTEPVQWMVDNDITTGTSPTCFSPDDPVTRGQAAAFLWRIEGFPEPLTDHPFTDVVAAYQQDPVSWLAENEITTGTTATTFSPDDTLTRGQMAALMYRAAGEPAAAPTTFGDVVKDWQLKPVGWMEAEEITTGTTPTTFSPEDPVTRGQFAAFSYRWKGEPAVEIDPIGLMCIRITGEGTTQMRSPYGYLETVRFQVDATGGERDPGDGIPASGEIHLNTVTTPGQQWTIHGSVICIRDLSPWPGYAPGVWEVRFRAIDSTHPDVMVGVPAIPEGGRGEIASFYVKDDPSGDTTAFNTGGDHTCGPRGGVELSGLQSGDARVDVGCQPANTNACLTYG